MLKEQTQSVGKMQWLLVLKQDLLMLVTEL
jgi:hypothetical protein